MRIGLDIMGGDHAPVSTVRGAVMAAEDLKGSCQLVLIGDQDKIHAELEQAGGKLSDFEIVHASQVVKMTDHLTRAFASSPDSSIAVGFGMMKAGKLDAFAGAGNTGAMLVGSMYSINAIPGVIRPCITSVLPREDGTTGIILDVGMNADCKPDVLYQFAILGSIYVEHVYGVKDPKVGLLNIGEEEEKGNLLTLTTHKMMKDTRDFNFVGNVEGRDLFDKTADVVVCDGFTGNVVLKEAEAIYTLLLKRGIQDEYFERFNYENYGGTPILGINGTVVIGHGISGPKAIRKMIHHTKEVVEADLPARLKEAFKQ